jgi:hypothetical protein
MRDEESRGDLREHDSHEAGDQPHAEEEAPDEPELAAPEFVELSPAEAAREMALCRQTLRRIEWMIAVAGAAGAAAVLRPLGWAVAAGVLLGAALGWINFRWLAASVNAIGERIVRARGEDRRAPGSGAIAARGVGRIALIVLFAYGIFECSVRGLIGFLAGLAVPVVAMMCEAVYEFVVSIRRPS